MNRLLLVFLLSHAIASPSFGYMSGNATAAAATTDRPAFHGRTRQPSSIVSGYLTSLGGANTIVVGHALQFTAHVTYSDGSASELPDAQGNKVTWWGTSNAAVATISSDGDVTAVGAGKVNIEAKMGTLRLHRRRVTASNAVVPVVAQQPTINCSANPSIINQGGTTTITAIGDSAQNLPLTYTYSSSAGSISGNNTTATLETSGVSAGIITVTCAVDQQGGGTASATIKILAQSVTGAQALTNFQFTDSVGV